MIQEQMNFLQEKILESAPCSAWEMFANKIGGCGHTAFKEAVDELIAQELIVLKNGVIEKANKNDDNIVSNAYNSNIYR